MSNNIVVPLGACPLWGGQSRSPSNGGDYYDVTSRRAGGRYRISGTAYEFLTAKKTPALAARVTTWLVDQRRQGDDRPVITSDIIRTIEATRQLRASEQIHRFFLFLVARNFRFGDHLSIAGPVDDKQLQDVDDLCAWLELETSNQLPDFVRVLKDDRLLEADNLGRIRLTSRGFDRLEQVQMTPSPGKQAFVAMWFDPSMSNIFQVGFEIAIHAAGYNAMRIDKKEHSNKIDDEIISEIRKSKFVVADFTCGSVEANSNRYWVARGGVYFEAGFAMGLGIPVIWCCREDCIEGTHFDTRQFAHVPWKTPEELKTRLYRRIAAVIGVTPDARGLPV